MIGRGAAAAPRMFHREKAGALATTKLTQNLRKKILSSPVSRPWWIGRLSEVVGIVLYVLPMYPTTQD